MCGELPCLYKYLGPLKLDSSLGCYHHLNHGDISLVFLQRSSIRTLKEEVKIRGETKRTEEGVFFTHCLHLVVTWD